MENFIKPGTDNQAPGDYIEVGPQGERVCNPLKVTIELGDRLPPAQRYEHLWKKL